MTTIGWVPLSEYGHIGPLTRVAKQLNAKGIKSVFFIDESMKEHVQSMGFECYPPYDFLVEENELKDSPFIHKLTAMKEWEELLLKSGVTLLAVDVFNQFLGLLAYKISIPTIVFHTHYPYSGEYGLPPSILSLPTYSLTRKILIKLNTFLKVKKCQLTRLVKQDLWIQNWLHYADEVGFPRSEISYDNFYRWWLLRFGFKEIVFGPKILNLEGINERCDLYYVEPSVDIERPEVFFDDNSIDQRPLIYCALGTHEYLYSRAIRIFSSIIEILRLNPQWQAIIAVGSLDLTGINIPPNVKIFKRAPQLQILKRSHLCISHGGLNTVKESIYFGVPQLVIPMINDQAANAARVSLHGIGQYLRPRAVTIDSLFKKISSLLNEPYFRINSQAMAQNFRNLDLLAPSVDIFNEIINKNS